MILDFKDPQLKVIVKDDGVGYHHEQNSTDKKAGIGLRSVEQRIKSVGGTLAINNLPRG